MAPGPTGEPAMVHQEWLSLRQKHKQETEDFQRRVNRAQHELLVKHKNEEQQFWAEQTEPSTAAQTIPAPNSPARKTTKPQAISSTTKAKPQPAKCKRTSRQTTTAPFSRSSNAQPRPASSTATSAPRSQSRAAPEIIDLCTDDEDDEVSTASNSKTNVQVAVQDPKQATTSHTPPALSSSSPAPALAPVDVPGRSMQLFGNIRTTPQLGSSSPDLPQEISKDGRAGSMQRQAPSVHPPPHRTFDALPKSLRHVTPPSTPENHGHTYASPPQSSQQGDCNTHPHPLHQKFKPYLKTADHEVLNNSTPQATSVFATPPPSHQRPQFGAGLAKAWRAASENASLRENDVYSTKDRHSLKTDVTNSVISHAQDFSHPTNAPRECCTEFNEKQQPRSLADTEAMDVCPLAETQTQPLSSAPSNNIRESIEQTLKPNLSTPGVFKKPFKPASVSHAPLEHHSLPSLTRSPTAASQTSGFTLLATPRTDRLGSGNTATFGTFEPSGRNRKRKARDVDLSDDENVSDYAPSEPDSPLAAKSTKAPALVAGVKKTKTTTAYAKKPTSKPPNTLNSQGKNAYGFKTPKPSIQTTTPCTPPRRQTATSKPSTPAAPSKPSSRTFVTPPTPASPSTRSTAPSSSISAPKPRPTVNSIAFLSGKRPAAVAAERKLHGYFEEEEEFLTECAIQDADASEEAALPQGMRAMSITPSPSRGAGERVTASSGPCEEHKGEIVVVDAIAPRSRESTVKPAASTNKDTHSTTNSSARSTHRGYRRPLVEDDDDDELDPTYDIRSDKSWKARQ